MTQEELRLLLEELRAGRQEGAALEYKRQWWNFKEEKGADEFIRDVSAMANALDSSVERHILIGYKDGHLHDARAPVDEAEIQERLRRRIDPPPQLRLLNFVEEGKKLSVLVLHSFDQPHVTRYPNENKVHVRVGSQIQTASRRHFDLYYSEQGPRPELRFGRNAARRHSGHYEDRKGQE